MKILFVSRLFAPSVGGVETVGRLLSREFVRAGHAVNLITSTPGEQMEINVNGVYVHRNPDASTTLKLVKWSDVVFHNQISLRAAWPLCVNRRPWIVSTHTWLTRPNGHIGWQDRMKRAIIRRSVRVAVSRAVQAHLPPPSVILPNPYDDEIFHHRECPRPRELIFVGRLVSDKGVDILLEALLLLRNKGLKPALTIAGDGPAAGSLKKFVHQHSLAKQVEFVGTLQGEQLARQLNAHQIAVVPSRWQEPFGLVALEAIACGCVVVGSDGGGLPEAIGPCGVTFARENAQELARQLEILLKQPEGQAVYQGHAAEHLKPHLPAAVADQYLKLFAEVQAANQ